MDGIIAPPPKAIELGPSECVLITGGARSGKSRFAEGLAKGFRRVVYLATAEALDDEMSQRIARHRSGRPASWRTIEEPIRVSEAIEACRDGTEVVLLDCVTLWISNLIGSKLSDEAVLGRVGALAEVVGSAPCTVLAVTNEVGLGIVPANPMARRFRDLAGQANQMLAQSMDRVYFLAAGCPLRLK